ncbi:MAG: polysaccharide biosynthesis/export family protein, partial [Gammaproteobacteria bacterium]|nr:polysaccharide biosynthesis/export family protein [Gammaproteobacteria bacterium]
MQKSAQFFLLTTAAAMAVIGCAPSVSTQAAGGTATEVAAGATPDTEDFPDLEYQIGPGDQLEVFVWRHDDVSTSVPVRPDGKISTP